MLMEFKKKKRGKYKIEILNRSNGNKYVEIRITKIL